MLPQRYLPSGTPGVDMNVCVAAPFQLNMVIFGINS
jgi:hypothetical protein